MEEKERNKEHVRRILSSWEIGRDGGWREEEEKEGGINERIGRGRAGDKSGGGDGGESLSKSDEKKLMTKMK